MYTRKGSDGVEWQPGTHSPPGRGTTYYYYYSNMLRDSDMSTGNWITSSILRYHLLYHCPAIVLILYSTPSPDETPPQTTMMRGRSRLVAKKETQRRVESTGWSPPRKAVRGNVPAFPVVWRAGYQSCLLMQVLHHFPRFPCCFQ